MTRHFAKRTDGRMACLATAIALSAALCLDVDRSLARPESVQPARPVTAIPPIPSAQLALYQRDIGRLGPQARSWIESEAQVERAKPSLDLVELSAAIHARFGPSRASAAAAAPAVGLSGSDVAELAFLVIFEMVHDNDSDLQRQMLEAEAHMAAKQSIATTLNALEQSMGPAPLVEGDANPNAECWTSNATLEELKMQLPCHPTTAEVAAAVSTLRNDLDAENDLSETESIRLQMLMDTRSKLLQTASDMEESMSDAETAIVGNLAVPSGLGSCPAGFVPREAYAGDRSCVNLVVHEQTMTDNRAAPSHTNPQGLCVQGYVWRRAIPTDHVCVTPASRAQAQSTMVQPCKYRGRRGSTSRHHRRFSHHSQPPREVKRRRSLGAVRSRPLEALQQRL